MKAMLLARTLVPLEMNRVRVRPVVADAVRVAVVLSVSLLETTAVSPSCSWEFGVTRGGLGRRVDDSRAGMDCHEEGLCGFLTKGSGVFLVHLFPG